MSILSAIENIAFFDYRAIKTFEQSHVKGGRRNEYSFSNKIFGGWDMCIMSEETAQLTSISIVRELEVSG